MIPYLAVAMALLIGFCLGCLTMALSHAAQRVPAGYRRLFVGERPEDHLRSALQLLSSLTFAKRDAFFDNEAMWQLLLRATQRIEAAMKQLEKEVA